MHAELAAACIVLSVIYRHVAVYIVHYSTVCCIRVSAAVLNGFVMCCGKQALTDAHFAQAVFFVTSADAVCLCMSSTHIVSHCDASVCTVSSVL